MSQIVVRDIGIGADDAVGTALVEQRLARKGRCQGDDASGAGSPGRFDARQGILEDDTFGRRGPEGFGGPEVDLRVGLAAGNPVAREAGVETVVDAAVPQAELHVGHASRGAHGAADPPCTEPVEQCAQSFDGADLRSV